MVCRSIFDGNHYKRTLANDIEAAMPRCGCEQYSVSSGSPGIVEDKETVIRLVISPRDLDDETGELAAAPFEKAFETGVSVLRDSASDEDCRCQAEDILPHKLDQPRKAVHAITTAAVAEVRSLTDEDGERIFAVYDQVVPRRNPDHSAISTHAGIFARRPPKGGGKKQSKDAIPLWQLRKDYAGKLFDLFAAGRIETSTFREHLFAEQNARAQAGEYVTE